MKKLKITETSLRDGHQSLIATRLKTDEIIPILETMDQVGYYAMEVWGGATFDACIRFLNEDPWERLRLIRKHVKNTKLQMLLRGQNLLGYRNYADDTVEKFIELSIKNGIDIIRVFDALNDVRNLEASIKAIKKYNGHCQCAISYTTSPIHTPEYYLELIKTMESMGADSICIKDMAGVLTPYKAYDLVKRIKEMTDIPIDLHTHCTGGIADMIYMKAVEAGVDIIDTAISPFSGGTSQPPTESLSLTFSEMERNPGLDMEKLLQVAEYLKEVPRVRKDLGYPPLVTPMSQMVGTQALFNVLTGERYKLVPKEIKDYVRGNYGKSPAPISDEFRKKIIGDEEVITVRPADLIEPEFEKMKKEAGDLAKTDEDVLAVALFPQVAPKFLENKYNKKSVEKEEDNKIKFINVTM